MWNVVVLSEIQNSVIEPTSPESNQQLIDSEVDSYKQPTNSKNS
jgi:hypothetical protein